MKALSVVDKPGKVEMTVGIWSMECFWSSPPKVLGRSKLLPPPYFLVRLSHRWQDKLEVVMCTSGGQYSSIPMPAPVPYPLSQRIFRECSMELQGIRRTSGLTPMAPVVNNLPAVLETQGGAGSNPESERSPEGGNVFLPVFFFNFSRQYSCLENPHGQRSLAGYNPEGHKESDVTEQTSTGSLGLPWKLASSQLGSISSRLSLSIRSGLKARYYTFLDSTWSEKRRIWFVCVFIFYFYQRTKKILPRCRYISPKWNVMVSDSWKEAGQKNK